MPSKSAPRTGPFVAAAFLCRRIDTAPNGSLTVHGMVGSLIHTNITEEPALTLQPFELELVLLVAFWAGDFTGSKLLTVTATAPDGEVIRVMNEAIKFPETDTLAHFQVTLRTKYPGAGTYYYAVLLDGREVTRVPLRIFYRRGLSVSSVFGP